MLFVTSDNFFLSKLTGLGQNTQQKGINFILTVKSLTKRTLSIIETLENILSLLRPEDQSRTISSFDHRIYYTLYHPMLLEIFPFLSLWKANLQSPLERETLTLAT